MCTPSVWAPHPPHRPPPPLCPALHTPIPGEIKELPSRSPALSLDLPIRTAPKFRGLDRGRPLLLLPKGQTPSPSPTHTLKHPGRSRAADPSFASFGTSRQAPSLARAPRPLPRLQMAAPRVGLEAPRHRPAAAGGRSLPPSQLLRQRPGWTASRRGQARPQALIGAGALQPRGTQDCEHGEGALQAPGEEAESEGAGKEGESLTTLLARSHPLAVP